MASERLQKIMARVGLGSRRACEEWITSGRVRVNGKVVTELGTRADLHSDKIEVDGKRVIAKPMVYIVLHKPRGVVSTLHDPEGRPTVGELLANLPTRLHPIGRLDFATSGVLLASNDGDFSHGLLHPRKAVPKTYVVKVKGTMTEADIAAWGRGIVLDDGPTLPAQASLLRYEGDKTWLSLTITEGRNQQVRRMGEASGFPVMRLARMSVAGITADGLMPGEWRHLSRDELLTLRTAYGVPKRIVSPAPEAPQSPRAHARPTGAGPKRPAVGVDGTRRAAGSAARAPQPSDAPTRGRRPGPDGQSDGQRPTRRGPTAARDGQRGAEAKRPPTGRTGRSRTPESRTDTRRPAGDSPPRRGPRR